MSELMSLEKMHDLKKLSIELKKYVEGSLAPLKNSLSNDWRRVKDLLNKVSNDHRKVELAISGSENIIRQIDSLMGVIHGNNNEPEAPRA